LVVSLLLAISTLGAVVWLFLRLVDSVIVIH